MYLLFFSPLHYGAQGGHLEIVELVLSHGANINIQDDQ